MPNESSRIAPVTFLDPGPILKHLKAEARRVCDGPSSVVAVVLFGSFAHGRPTPGSDVDLLVVLREDPRRMLDRILEYTQPFELPGLSLQVLPWTVEELTGRLAAGDPFAHEILATGQVLAGTVTPAVPLAAPRGSAPP